MAARDSVDVASASSARSDVDWVIAAYREHFRYVYALVGRLGVPAASVEDTAQEVFLILHRRRSEFRGDSSVKTWLHGITVHVARRSRDAIRRRAQVSAPLVEAVDPSSPEEDLERRRALQTLDRLLDTLADEQREVFVLAEIAGCSAPEIAEILGVKLNTVYSRLRLARSRMKGALEALRAQEGARHGAA